MVGLFRRSLSQDDVDRYTNTWAVILFLFLALLSLLMPLSPTLSDSIRPGSRVGPAATIRTTSTSSDSQTPPRVRATCWAPSPFSDAHKKYADEYCADVANAMLSGVKSDRTLYELTDTAVSVEELNLTSIKASRKGYFEGVEAQQAQQQKNEKVRKSTRELVDFRTPVILFLLALLLKLPHILWNLLCDAMTSCMNVDQTLQACVESRSLDLASQKQIYEETAVAVSESVRNSRSTASSLYLFMKILTLFIVLAETVFVSKFVVPDIQAMETDFVENPLTAMLSLHSGDTGTTTTQPPAAGNVTESTVDANAVEQTEQQSTGMGLFDYPNNILRCPMKIHQYKNIQKFIIQCMFTRVEESAAEATHASSATSMTTQTTSPATSATIESTLLLYQALFTIVLAFLALLVIANVINTISWFLKLLISSYATSMGLPSNVARDVILLVNMAWLNAGAGVARGLANSSVWSNRIESTDAEPMLESKA